MHVAGVPQEGMAVDVAGSSGLVEFTEDEPYDVDSREDKQRIPFQVSEVIYPSGNKVFNSLWDSHLLLSAEIRCKESSPMGFLVVVSVVSEGRLS